MRRGGKRHTATHLRLIQSEMSAWPVEHVEVHDRVHEHHPEILAEDVYSAWKNAFLSRPRTDDGTVRQVAIGQDGRGRLLEMVAQRIGPSTWLVYHAMTPPSDKMLKELRALWREK